MTVELIQSILSVLGLVVALATAVGNAPYVRGTKFGEGLLKFAGVDVVGIAKVLLPLIAAGLAALAASRKPPSPPQG